MGNVLKKLNWFEKKNELFKPKTKLNHKHLMTGPEGNS